MIQSFQTRLFRFVSRCEKSHHLILVKNLSLVAFRFCFSSADFRVLLLVTFCALDLANNVVHHVPVISFQLLPLNLVAAFFCSLIKFAIALFIHCGRNEEGYAFPKTKQALDISDITSNDYPRKLVKLTQAIRCKIENIKTASSRLWSSSLDCLVFVLKENELLHLIFNFICSRLNWCKKASSALRSYIKTVLGWLHNRVVLPYYSILRNCSMHGYSKLCFIKSVIGGQNRSIQDLILCLNLGNCDAIEIILQILDTQKDTMDIRSALCHSDCFGRSRFHFDKYCYEICARILICLERSDSFFIVPQKKDDFVYRVRARIKNYLEFSQDSDRLTYMWRERRFQMTKLHFLNVEYQLENEKKLNWRILDVLHDTRMALDTCISKFFGVTSNSFYPHALNRLTDRERKTLKSGVSCKVYDQQRLQYIRKRLKEDWLCRDEQTPLDCKVIEGLLRDGFSALKGRKIPDDLLNFVAKREHHIITKEGAWHSVWIESDNMYKHVDNSWDGAKFESDINELRNITGQFRGEAKVTAYDVAHRAAEFAEQTVALFIDDH